MEGVAASVSVRRWSDWVARENSHMRKRGPRRLQAGASWTSGPAGTSGSGRDELGGRGERGELGASGRAGASWARRGERGVWGQPSWARWPSWARLLGAPLAELGALEEEMTSGNYYHDFNDNIIPLFITTRHLGGEVQLLVKEKQAWWFRKYGEIVDGLTRHEALDLDGDGRVHCYRRAFVGLRSHKDLSIDPRRAPNNMSMVDFKRFLMWRYALPREADGEEAAAADHHAAVAAAVHEPGGDRVRGGGGRVRGDGVGPDDAAQEAAGGAGRRGGGGRRRAGTDGGGVGDGERVRRDGGGARVGVDEPAVPADERGGGAGGATGADGGAGHGRVRRAAAGHEHAVHPVQHHGGGEHAVGDVPTERRNSGVDRAVVQSLPVFRFGALRGQKAGLECAVCLGRFQPTEALRLLPKCRHGFHVECVDTWLDAHSTCPLCRSRVDPEDVLLLPEPPKPSTTGPPEPPEQKTAAAAAVATVKEKDKDAALAPAPAPSPAWRRISGRHSTGSVRAPGRVGPTSRRSADLEAGGGGGGAATVGCFDVAKVRKDRVLMDEPAAAAAEPDPEAFERRFGHRILVSTACGCDGETAPAAQQRWSDLKPADLMFVRSEMLVTETGRYSCSAAVSSGTRGRTEISGRSLSEIAGVSRLPPIRAGAGAGAGSAARRWPGSSWWARGSPGLNGPST